MKGKVLADDVRVTVTRDYGETATEKSEELLFHILVATFGVVLLVWLALGWREAIVVLVAVPVTLALTLLAEGLTPSRAAREVARRLKVSRNLSYGVVQEVAKGLDEDGG